MGTVIFTLAIIGVCWWFFTLTKKSDEKAKHKLKEEMGIYAQVSLFHISGLNFPTQTAFSLNLYEDYLLIRHHNNEIKLGINKIKTVSLQLMSQQTDTILLAMFKGKKNLDYRLLVISYVSDDNELKHLTFSPSYNNNTDKLTISMINKPLFDFFNELDVKVSQLSEHQEYTVREL